MHFTSSHISIGHNSGPKNLRCVPKLRCISPSSGDNMFLVFLSFFFFFPFLSLHLRLLRRGFRVSDSRRSRLHLRFHRQRYFGRPFGGSIQPTVSAGHFRRSLVRRHRPYGHGQTVLAGVLSVDETNVEHSHCHALSKL